MEKVAGEQGLALQNIVVPLRFLRSISLASLFAILSIFG